MKIAGFFFKETFLVLEGFMVIFILRGWSPSSEGAPSPEGVTAKETILTFHDMHCQTIDRLHSKFYGSLL